jgi:alanine-synthesizing transaminase
MFSRRTKWNLTANRLSRALDAHRASAKRLLDLTISNPTECGFACDADAIFRALSNPAALHYNPDPRGLHNARAAIAEYYGARASRIEANDIFLTTSTSEAYSFAFRVLCDPGDEILIPSPSYPLFDFLADIHDVHPARYPLLYDHGWQIDFHALEKAIGARTRAAIVVHPNNPTGHFTKRTEAQRLAEICAAHDLALIADEVFLDFALTNEIAESFAANADALTFITSGLSKISGLPQMKAAWLLARGPAQLKAKAVAALEIIADTYLSMNAPIQHALPVFLDQRHVFQKQLMQRVRKNLAELDRQLSAQQSCCRLKIEGGWYAVIRLPVIHDDQDFAVRLLEARSVYIHPGHFYDFPGNSYVVLSLITPENTFAEGLALLLSQANE